MFARLSLCLRNVALNKSGHRSFSTASLKFISLGGKQLVTCIFLLPLIWQTWLFRIVPLCFNVFTSHYALSLLKVIIPVHVYCSFSGRRKVISVEKLDVPTFSSINMDGSSSPPPSSPTPSPSPTTPTPTPSSRRPPLCHLNYDHTHCEHCGRCVYLCGEHHGCYCGKPWFDQCNGVTSVTVNS